MALIRSDNLSVYVKTNGSYYRPIFPIGYQHVYKDGSKYQQGEKVKANAWSGTELARVGDEVWFCHGHYIPVQSPYSTKDSNEAYKPDYHCW